MSRQIRNKKQKLHKKLGRIYFLCILFGGLSGLYLAFEATGGVLSTFGFGSLSVFLLGIAGMALYKIKQHQVEQHRKWMIRNYSLTFAAVSNRPHVLPKMRFISFIKALLLPQFHPSISFQQG